MQHKDHHYNPLSKIYYRPIEAAIRWSDLVKHEKNILNVMQKKNRLESNDFPQWPALLMNTERIYDAMLNNELPYGKEGITIKDETLLDHPDITVRHIDLKIWMSRYYPDQRPSFLFSDPEQVTHSTITFKTAMALLVEREALKSQLAQCQISHEQLQEQYATLLKRYQPEGADTNLPCSDRAENTYLNIIGCMLKLLLGHTPSGQPYSLFRTQEAVISALAAHSGHLMGLSERTLQGKFAEVNRRLLT
ncbi:hypothetical protein JBO49_16195 [Serratia fonticola]|uniref:hypothetical protein n=1 Tax=Serratia fonticola TaxID=47917 RepID=UPI00192A86CB|nr:hypothetical protein [Serratia fonticola]MBL5862147.1 hypothetical protein [Serratia fonticola]